jgi:hypothetical protein
MRRGLLIIFCLLQVFAHSALSLEYWASDAAQDFAEQFNQPWFGRCELFL